ncbi:Ubiquinone biosynthesis O-methyltransferase, mitochondrial [subsurface metagenome]|jgi:2-polyprenyl-3-methyl-5-hydroxy-6-metoxy-1,4-benzoquinol methylase
MKELKTFSEIQLPSQLPPELRDFFYEDKKTLQHPNPKNKNRFYHEVRCNKIVDFVRELNLPIGSKILDLGCGSGDVSLALASFGYRVYAADIVVNKLRYLVKKAETNNLSEDVYLCCINAYNLPFKDNQFDLVILAEVIEHFEYPDKVIAEIKRISNKNGYIIISTPNRSGINLHKAPKCQSIQNRTSNMEFMPSELKYIIYHPDFKGARHVFEFSEKELLEFCKGNGLVVDKVTKTTNKLISNFAIKLPISATKLNYLDEKFSNALFSSLLYSSIIVRCHIDRN